METNPIVIVGGGFAGLRAALDLNKIYAGRLDVPIYLIDPSPYHVYTPALYDLVQSANPRIGLIPLADLLEGTHIRFIQEKVVSVDMDLKNVITESRRIPYTDLVLALGTQTRPVTKDDMGFMKMKSVDDIMNLRFRIAECFADAKGVPAQVCHSHFLVVGGGPTGVEFAAGLQSFINREAKRHGVSAKAFHVTLLEKEKRILPYMTEKVSQRVASYLKKRGLTVATHSGFGPKAYQRLIKENNRPPQKTVVWTVGIEPHPLLLKIKGLRHDDYGKVLVYGSLQAIDNPDIWVVGDASSASDSGSMRSAVAHGRHVAQAIKLARSGQIAPAYCPQERPIVLQLSPEFGIAATGDQVVEGMSAIWYKRWLDLRYFLSVVSVVPAIKLWLSRGKAGHPSGSLWYHPSEKQM